MKTLVFLSVALVVFLSVALVASLGMLLPQQHGEDAQCTNVCWPSDGREMPDEDGGLPTYRCGGVCQSLEGDPCVNGDPEHRSCGEYCRKQCCRCHSSHCP